MRTAFVLLILWCHSAFAQLLFPEENLLLVPFGTIRSTTFATGQTLGSVNNNVDDEIGFEIVVGGSDVTVTHLGRWTIAGNSGTHTMQIRNAAGTSLASASLNLSGATSGQYNYVELAAPYVMTAGGTYYILSDELNGGDQWYWSDTTFTHTAVGTVAVSAYYNGAIGTSTTTDHNWGPVDFKYSSP